MRGSRSRLSVGALAIAILCSVALGPTSSVADEPEDVTLDDRFLAIETQVPGFGGVFVNEAANTFNVWLVNPSPAGAAAAQAAVAEMLDDPWLLAFTPVALPARFRFSQLKPWQDALIQQVLAMPGVISTDIDDRSNRLSIGVEDLSASKLAITQRLISLGIPVDAVKIFEREPVRFDSSLQGYHRPLVGGLQIEYWDTDESSYWICSLGFIAHRGSLSNPPGFVTNSHCSSRQGYMDSDPYYQHLDDLIGLNRVATETRDPAFFTGGACPSGRRCRYSDSLFAQIGGCPLIGCDLSYSKGKLARAQRESPTWGGTLDSIVAKGDPVVGLTITKLGRTTGRTFGEVEAVCVPLNVAGTNITLLCQGDANYLSAGGDSGGSISKASGNNRALAGLHWGSSGSFSLISQIQRTAEMGNLLVCDGEPCG